MSDAPREARSFVEIRDVDLQRLAEIGEKGVEEACRSLLKSSIYRHHAILTCLCQGGALQYRQQLDGLPIEQQRGIHDFDIWTFFRAHPRMPFPPRTRREFDFGDPRFGRRPEDKRFTGRKVDFLGRSVEVRDEDTPIDAVLRWVQTPGGPKSSPYEIRQRPIFVISPGPEFGRMIWPLAADA